MKTLFIFIAHPCSGGLPDAKSVMLRVALIFLILNAGSSNTLKGDEYLSENTNIHRINEVLHLSLNENPDPPENAAAIPSVICRGDLSGISAISEGNIIDWYTIQSGGTAIGSSDSGAGFQVSPATSTTYYAESRTPSGLTSITRSAVTVTVNEINPGTIVKGYWNPGPDCSPLNPNTIGSETDASGQGTITYSWEQSTDGGSTWVPAAGTSTTNYRTFNPDPMALSTSLRRMATSTLNPANCSDYSNILNYVVYPLPSVGPILPGGQIPKVCVGAQITLTNATPGGVWSSADVSVATVEGGVVTGMSAGTVSIRYTVTDANNCVKTVTRSVHVLPLPSVIPIYHS